MIDLNLTEKCLNINLKINFVDMVEQRSPMYYDFKRMEKEDIIKSEIVTQSYILPSSVIKIENTRIEKMTKECLCYVCKDIPIDPIECVNAKCNSIYCRFCIEEYLRDERTKIRCLLCKKIQTKTYV